MSGQRCGPAAVVVVAAALSGCGGNQALLPLGAGLPPADKATVLVNPFISGCMPTTVIVTRQDAGVFRKAASVAATSRRKGARAALLLPPGTYHIGAAWCLSGNSTVLRVSAPHDFRVFHLTEPDTFTGSLARFTVGAGEVVDIGTLWFDKPSATSDQGRVSVLGADAGTVAELEKELPELAGRIIVRPAVAILRTDLPKS